MNIKWKLRMAAAQREVWTGAQLRRLLAEKAGLELSILRRSGGKTAGVAGPALHPTAGCRETDGPRRGRAGCRDQGVVGAAHLRGHGRDAPSGSITTLREDDLFHNRQVVSLGDTRHLHSAKAG